MTSPESVLELSVIDDYGLVPEGTEEGDAYRRDAINLLKRQRGPTLLPVTEDRGERVYRLQNKTATKVVCRVRSTWEVAVAFQTRVLFILDQAGTTYKTCRLTLKTRFGRVGPESIVDRTEEFESLPSPSPSSVVGEEEEEENKRDEQGGEEKEAEEEENFLKDWELASSPAAMVFGKAIADAVTTIAVSAPAASNSVHIEDDVFVLSFVESTPVRGGSDLL